MPSSPRPSGVSEAAALEAILNCIAEGVVVTDAAGRFTHFNPAAERILGIGALETSPEEWTRLYGLYLPDGVTPYPPEDLPLYRATKGESSSEVEIYVRHPEAPQGLWLSVTATPLVIDGEIRGGIAVFRDITRDKESQAALEHARDEAQAANRAKSRFLATMTHEMRTPLTAVIGLSDLVLASPLSQIQREYLGMVRSSGESLLGVINETLDFSRIEAGKLNLRERTFRLEEILAEASRAVAYTAHVKGIELLVRTAPGVPPVLVGDEIRLRQILINLLGNAVKFTERGEVELTVEKEHEGQDPACLRFSVRDTGPGVPAEDREIIFELFEQTDGSLSRRHGGTGLGLAISARLVGLMGGRIWVESEEGVGSVFRFNVSLKPGPEEQDAPLGALRGSRALVVAVHPGQRDSLQAMLRGAGLRPVAVRDADEARKEMDAHPDDLPRLALIDAELPGEGLRLAREIEAGSGGRCRAVLLRNAAEPPAGDAGLLRSLVRPVFPLDLERVLAEDEGTARVPPGPERSLRVLVVEDSEVNRRLIVTLLERRGHVPEAVATGPDALAALDAHPFDLVLMDLQLPGMDGLEATRRIRERELGGERETPVVALTAEMVEGTRERCLAAGMNEVLSKPVRVRKLFETIESLAANPVPAIDWPGALAAVGGDREILADLVSRIRTEGPRLLAGIREAAAARDAEALGRKAHTFKGSVRYLGETPCFATSLDLERAAKADRLEDAEALIARLEEEFASLVRLLQTESGRYTPG